MGYKFRVMDSHCSGCVWAKGRLCPFQRCVQRYGWTPKGEQDGQKKQERELPDH